MRHLPSIPILFFNLLIFMSYSHSSQNEMLSDLLTCKYAFDDVKNNPQTGVRINRFIQSSFQEHDDAEYSIPKQDMNVFGAKVLGFKPGFGISPGFSVSLDSEFATVKQHIETEYNLTFDTCTKSQCFHALSDTETLALLNNSGTTYAGCIYPYVK